MRRLMQAMRVGAFALPVLGFFTALFATSKIPRFDENAHGDVGMAYADAPSCASSDSTGDSDCGSSTDCGCSSDASAADSADSADCG